MQNSDVPLLPEQQCVNRSVGNEISYFLTSKITAIGVSLDDSAKLTKSDPALPLSSGLSPLSVFSAIDLKPFN